MIEHVKPSGLSFCRWFAAVALGCLALNAHAIDQIYNWNGLEFVRSGNAHHVHPASPESTRLRGGWVLDISDVEPKVTGKHDLPYQHKGGALAKINVATNVNKAAMAAKAADAVKAAVQKGASNPYLTVAAIGCSVFCDALISWGIDSLKNNGDGTFSAEIPDPNVYSEISNGKSYYFAGCTAVGLPCTLFNTYSAVCRAYAAIVPGKYGLTGVSLTSCKTDSVTVSGTQSNGVPSTRTEYIYNQNNPSCPSGSPVVNGVCNGSAPKLDAPLDRVFQDNIVNKPWGPVQISVVKALIQNGHNVFTDGTDTTITGPDSVPLSTTKSSWPVNVLPGTTTPAPAGHTGATDSGTQTTTTTTTAKNTFSPSGSSSGGSGSSGGPASLGSMTTTQQTTTTTTITNNITNNTSTSVTNNVTETDEAPEEEEKDFCKKNPDALACAEIDTPEQETPTGQLNISYEYVDIFGNGSCPSDSYLNTHGQSLKVWDWAATCENVQSYFRPILIACCAFAAFVIVSAGAKE